MRDASDLWKVFEISASTTIGRVLTTMKARARMSDVAIGRAGLPVSAGALATEMNLSKAMPDVTPSEVQEAILFLVREGFLGLVPNRTCDTCDFRLTVPLSARERKQRSRQMQSKALRQEGVTIVSVTVPAHVTREEVQALVDEKWPRRFKQPDLL